jgi:hypothetical protein
MNDEPERIIPLKDACAWLNCTERYLRQAFFDADMPIVEFSPRKRGVRQSDYEKLVRSRMKPALKEAAHV